MKTHNLKCWESVFRATVDGSKPYEVRRNDRDYEVGDVLVLWRWDPVASRPTGEFTTVAVTALTQGRWGLPDDMCVMGFSAADARGNRGSDFGRALRVFGLQC